MKSISGIYSAPPRHWVGDGFPVRSLFSYNSHGRHVSPFLLLDHAGPMDFEPAERPRGVGEHPHRGFETVTIVYEGEVEHRDSTGAGGRIGPGDVQWMTAGSGILHEEFHSQAFTRAGGTLEMVQLWVNLPAAHKMTDPSYQTLLDADIPAVDLPDGAGQVRVIAGELDGHRGPARTFTPMHVWDLRLNRDGAARLDLPAGWNGLLVVLRGTVQINDAEIAREGELVALGAEREGVVVESNNDATVLVLSGQPIDEPIVGHGPFVMNTEEEIRQALHDFSTGQFGAIPA
ncbi:pirin family protein [Wenzhouxiangella sp. AB-CW3]|uniref:pirin family protein n=1 Tax=Wenzhouxiangella sp. AB-CW3 TaxID=2771012 RepID=UPI00168B2B85|nr:pirin family protein [Wenzhouxiangella sp. AB-CW3]QOC23461.1 pirin family protein [Wenzhouxiangella sp. AB-CW3]